MFIRELKTSPGSHSLSGLNWLEKPACSGAWGDGWKALVQARQVSARLA
jgi:hypothetical protein